MSDENGKTVTEMEVQSTVNQLLIDSVGKYMTDDEIRLLDAKLTVVKKHLDQKA